MIRVGHTSTVTLVLMHSIYIAVSFQMSCDALATQKQDEQRKTVIDVESFRLLDVKGVIRVGTANFDTRGGHGIQ